MIASFFKTLIQELPDKDKVGEKLKGVGDVILALTHINKSAAKAIVYLGEHLDAEKG